MNNQLRLILSVVAFAVGAHLVAWLIAKFCLWSLANAAAANGGIITTLTLTKLFSGAALLGGVVGLGIAQLINNAALKERFEGIVRARSAAESTRFAQAKPVN